MRLRDIEHIVFPEVLKDLPSETVTHPFKVCLAPVKEQRDSVYIELHPRQNGRRLAGS